MVVVGLLFMIVAGFFVYDSGWVFVLMVVAEFLFWISLYLFCFKLGFFCILYDFSMVCNVGLVFIWCECCGSSFFDSLVSYDVALWLFCLVCYWVFCGHFLHCLTNNNASFFVVVYLIRDIGLQSSLLLMYFPLYLCRYGIGRKKIAFVGLLKLK